MKYFYYPNLYSDTQEIVDCKYIDDKFAICLEQTIFYPKGGGQPCDTGTIEFNNNIWQVSLVVNIEGVIYHFLENYQQGLEIGDVVELRVDNQKRILNSKLHTIGHLIDEAMIQLELFDKLIPTKGYHYPPVSSVEYEGNIDGINLYDLSLQIQNKVNAMITTGFKTQSFFITLDQVLQFCHTQTYDVKALSKANQQLRVVIVWGNKGIMCGGTHIQDISQIGAIEIPKITFKKNILKISYCLK